MASQDQPKIASSSSAPTSFRIDPPLLNSSNPWATNEADLLALYNCPYTGAVTIRTSLWKAFKQHPLTHQYTFFDSKLGHATASINVDLPEGRGEVQDGETSSLNTLGYSPIAFEEYISMLVRMSRDGLLPHPESNSEGKKRKPFIVSVTGTAEEVAQCASHLLTVLNAPETIYPSASSDAKTSDLDLMMEINLSCPNIPDKPPPAYSLPSLVEYVAALHVAKQNAPRGYTRPLHIGIKTPPYTYTGQFQILIDALESSASLEGGCPISFITATNTLGNCLVMTMSKNNDPALGSANGTGIGGMAGDALHPLALGNVKTIRGMLDASRYPNIQGIQIIGIGGVSDAAGFKRMKSVGAAAVGVGTALGREGVDIFKKISEGLSQSDLAV
ncbi:related to dihydroorotate dehydrogenase A [Phialocephala subalpina]|uniref:Related to dihydroorotate dehydrogenase A n=1 Tax=Phialocephala subalpina TaxID=576137 RepID=A0A1L7XKF0_9HELO|nr:related to dihydroorotate dehydrogenase A [Phialocephala subalpina]